jgi:tetratricopeptide (TPR) repeat protein
VDEATLTDAGLLIGLCQYEQAERLLEDLVAEAEERGDDQLASHALEGLGTIATRQGREARALELFERALAAAGDADPSERETLYSNTARLRAYGGDPCGAVRLLEDVLARVESQPDHDVALFANFAISLSYAYADSGDYGKAGTVLARVLRDGGEDLDLRVRQRLYYALTRLNINTGRTDQAVEYGRKTLELTLSAGLEEFVFESYHQLAYTLLDAGDTEEAGRYLAEARRHGEGPLDEGFLEVEWARHALQLGDLDDAIGHADAAVDLLADRAVPGVLGRAYLVKARAYEARGEAARADGAYLMAIDALEQQTGWPTDLAKACRRYGKFLRSQGRLDAALLMLERAGDAGI